MVNFMWLAADKGVRLVAGTVVGFAVARYLGPARFGVLNYALAFIALFLPLTELGVDAVVRRRLITHPEDAGKLLATVWRLRFGAAAFVYLALAGYVIGAARFSEVGGLLLILGLTLFQSAGYTADMWMQANLRARVTVMTGWVALVFGAGLRLWLIGRGAGLSAFAWVSVAEGAVSCGLLWWAGWRSGLPALENGGFMKRGRELLKDAWPLLLAGVTVMLYMRVDVVMLRLLAGDREAGIYSAAVRLSELWYFVPMALASSVLPALLGKKAEGEKPYAEAMQRYYDLNAALAYGMVLVTVLLAKPLIAIVYGAAFAGAGPVLEWHAWAAVFVFLGVSRSQFLINERRLLFNLLTTALGAAVNVGLNWWLIPSHGALGAAWATLIAYGVAAWGGSWLHPAMRATAVMQTRALLIPLLGWRYLIRQ